ALQRGRLLVTRTELLEAEREVLVAPQPVQRMRDQLARVGEEHQPRCRPRVPREFLDALGLGAGPGLGLCRTKRLEREPDQLLATEWIERPTQRSSPVRGQRPSICSPHRILQCPRSRSHVTQRHLALRRQLGPQLLEELTTLVLCLPCSAEELGR